MSEEAHLSEEEDAALDEFWDGVAAGEIDLDGEDAGDDDEDADDE